MPDKSAVEGSRDRKEAANPPSAGHDDLDKALADSFPASDPPAQVVHGTTSNPRPHEKETGEKDKDEKD